jgi:ankyrin repeat protein
MKKTIIITAIALGFSILNLNATTTLDSSNVLEVIKSNPSVSPFCMSIVKGDIETVKKLIELGVNVNEKSNGMTPAMYAAKYNKVEILKLLVEKGADLEVKSEQGFRAEKYAKLSNAKEALAFLEGLES